MNQTVTTAKLVVTIIAVRAISLTEGKLIAKSEAPEIEASILLADQQDAESVCHWYGYGGNDKTLARVARSCKAGRSSPCDLYGAV
ncbi:MAG: hypothetical protein U5L95_00745 [Candidatus Saccharibacteria bacterium]|nr:hypothetical protein [Candidatus Saccharibacteria bacterium]